LSIDGCAQGRKRLCAQFFQKWEPLGIHLRDVLFTLVEVLSSTMRGVGDAVVPAAITMVFTCIVLLIYLWGYAFSHNSNLTIAVIYPISWVLTSIAFLLYYKSRKWMPEDLDEREEHIAGSDERRHLRADGDDRRIVADEEVHHRVTTREDDDRRRARRSSGG